MIFVFQRYYIPPEVGSFVIIRAVACFVISFSSCPIRIIFCKHSQMEKTIDWELYWNVYRKDIKYFPQILQQTYRSMDSFRHPLRSLLIMIVFHSMFYSSIFQLYTNCWWCFVTHIQKLPYSKLSPIKFFVWDFQVSCWGKPIHTDKTVSRRYGVLWSTLKSSAFTFSILVSQDYVQNDLKTLTPWIYSMLRFSRRKFC